MVVDVVLPDGTGFDALEVLRPVVGRLPTFIVTGDGDADFESRARAQQAWFSRKPLPSRMLEAFISTLVRSRAAGTIFASKIDAAHRLATLAGLWDSERDLLIAAVEMSTSHAALAERLGIGPRAVRERIGGVLEKLDACSLAQLICDIESAADGRGPYAHWLAD